MSPYRRIADAIRGQVERGDLVAGDRVPSTREVAQTWNVATATAAHALRTLAEEGVVRAVPRVGTVVASPRARALAQKGGAPRAGELTRARIVAAAIAIADDEGLGTLSLRAVASKVGAPVMSLYRHVGSKDELLRLMTEASLAEESLPAEPPHGWRAQLELGARLQWRVFRKHSWLARVVNITRPEPLPSALTYADWIFRALGSTGIDAGTQMRIHIILHGYIQGIAVNVESEAEAVGETGMSDEEWMQEKARAFEAAAASGRYPSFAKVLADLGDFDIDFDELFERGLAALLDGFAGMFEGANSTPRLPRKGTSRK